MNLKNFRIILLLIIPIICMLLSGYTKKYDVSQSKVYDYADIFTDIQEKQIQKVCLEYAELTKLDIVVATINDSKGKSTRRYADDFYDDMGFGYDQGGSGLIFLIDMENREFYISTAGIAMEYFKDDDIEKILTYMDSYMLSGNYCDAFFVFAASVRVQVESINEKSYEDVKPWFEGDYKSYKYYHKNVWNTLLVVFVFSMLGGVVILLLFLLRQKFKRKPDNSIELEKEEMIINKSSDTFIGLTVKKRRIYTLSNGSSNYYGDMSSSGGYSGGGYSDGGDHGGGGHSF